ncbi:DMT family transporter [Methylobrevis pamukkalensis]|uniref:EamA-like transporter family protein n=1 Tax=Methylobrevis pamukkalensis TaxID=1439726 RepID=A0A1E3H5X8_9HYPH|nr:DMT family transporter [Methylobrevis pamukkalensis]ODN71722.1 EamA-like transporter family protein [Methylobrevis pamukkalensis]
MKTLASPLPVFSAIIALLLLSIMDALVKALGLHFPVVEIVFLRYAGGAVVSGAVFLLMREKWPSRAMLRRAAFRSLIILCTAGLFFKTLTMLPLAEAVAITFTSPLIMALLGQIILKEPVGRRGAVALGIGFAGLVVMFQGRFGSGGSHADPLGYVYGLGASVSYSLAMILTRRDSARDSVVGLVTVQNLCAAAFSAPLALPVFVTPEGLNVWLFAAVGILGAFGHLAFAWAYAHAPASRLAPLEFTMLLWAPLFGLVMFGELPTIAMFAGSLLIVWAVVSVSRGGAKPALRTDESA